MDESLTQALVVGIDHYDAPKEEVRDLTGAVGDALAAVEWLLGIGVPAANIILNVSCRDDGPKPKPEWAAAGMTVVESATRDALWDSMLLLEARQPGGRLFVFLNGHGVWEQEKQRLFLAQDFSQRFTDRNLAIDEYVKFFRSLNYRQQFLFADCCAEQPPYTGEIRDRIRPGLPAVMGAANAGTCLIGCFAAAQGQRSYEENGRGYFMRTLLDALTAVVRDDEEELRSALRLDWSTGALRLSLNDLMELYVTQKVSELAEPKGPQTPLLDRADGALALPLLEFTPGETSALTVAVEPVDALPAVKSISLRAAGQLPPHFVKPPKLPPDGAVTVLLPRGLSVEAACSLMPDAPWESVESKALLTMSEPSHLSRFRFESAVTPATPMMATEANLTAPATLKIDIFEKDGTAWHGMRDALYDAAAKEAGLDADPGQGGAIDAGVVFFHHENGPEFRFAAGAMTGARRIGSDWTRALRTVLGDEYQFNVDLRGWDEPAAEGGIAFRIPGGTPVGLAGRLVDLELLEIEAIGDDDFETRRISISEAVTGAASWSSSPPAEVPPVVTGPGAFIVRLRLPWAPWSTTVRVAEGETVTVDLPASVGVPPLRVKYGPDLATRGRLYGRAAFDGPSAGAVGRTGLYSPEPVFLTPDRDRPPTAFDPVPALVLPGQGPSQSLIALLARQMTTFPVYQDRSLVVDETPAGFRVEPVSDVASPEWDALVSSGRLDSVTPADAQRLAETKWEDELLGLASAYAVWANRMTGYLETVLGNLRDSVRIDAVDMRLLELAALNREVQVATLAAALQDHALRGDVPLFRWGIGLALRLLGAVPEDDPAQAALNRWRASLRVIDATLSPASTWTCWTPRPPGG